ncbi:serine/threonine-protein kinase Nek11 isoform X12 [Bos indicus]|uniref:non-specific serine/threonine protein kinase n=1 Tax=Bos indicus TaxID=9915 RepID=A0ABM4STF0_BOSIN|nr:serine/threonine-protein kinase Nek11 isoform X10 [Bos indicus x Bos taurus]XP_061277715.1 serine/threonine-protein kinase Nek11 isoform X9 [Bos javanicus]
MLKFREAAKCVSGSIAVSTCPKSLIARRYMLQQKLGSGSFGTVFLVSDKKAKQGEELKVLKEICIGELNPNETVQATLEAQLLSKLNHPAIVKFHANFVEQDKFCIITEYCEGRDLDCKIQEYKEAGKTFPESQIIEWFIQLLLGVDYMHERKILHRDLKSKNIFLKNNKLKIGDFGVSRLLMGSCDLATTLTGTPHYMSPEALKHQGYDTKSDIWQKKIHLQTLRALSEVQKMTPRERMRVRKVQAADEEARKLKKLVEEKYEENNKRMRELRSRNFQRQTVDVLHECDDPASDNLPESQPIPSLDLCTLGSNVEDTIADLGDHEIPEDPLVAEEYYADVFDSCSEESEESEEGKTVFSVKDEEVEDEGPQPVYRTNQQDSDTEALARCLEHVLGCTTLDTRTVTSSAPDTPSEPTIFNSAMARTRMKHMRESAVQKLGAEVFEEVYSYLKRARQQGASEAEVWAALETVVPRASDCFEVDQLLYFEEQLLITRAEGVTLPQNHHEATVRSKQVPVDKAPVKIHQHCR